MAQGTTDIPEYAGKINASWYGAAPITSGMGSNGTSTSNSGGQEVEMAEETHRGDRDDDE